jgi:hypothetical protein
MHMWVNGEANKKFVKKNLKSVSTKIHANFASYMQGLKNRKEARKWLKSTNGSHTEREEASSCTAG